MYTIQLTETRQTKNPKTKTTYTTDKTEVKEITEEHYNNYVNSRQFFKNLGGSESAQKCYTCAGYKVYKMTSISPDKQTKVIREFKFTSMPSERVQETQFKHLSLMGKYNTLVAKNLLTEEARELFVDYKDNQEAEKFNNLHNIFDNLNK